MEDKQRAIITDQNSVDVYDLGNTAWVEGIASYTYETFLEVQPPSFYTVGDNINVTNDDTDESLNGEYEVLGAAVGQPGLYFDKG